MVLPVHLAVHGDGVHVQVAVAARRALIVVVGELNALCLVEVVVVLEC